MRSPHPWLVVFDLDGTLIDSSLDLCRSVNAALAHVGAPQLPDALIASYIGDGAAILMRRALGDPGDLDSPVGGRVEQQRWFQDAFNYFLAFYRVHKLDNTRLFDGVKDALAKMRAADPALLMAVLTNKPVRPSREICDALQISEFFFANYGGDSFETKKPHPEGLLRVIAEAKLLRSTKRDALQTFDLRGVVMVGDSDVDVATAKRAGVGSLGCLYGLAPQALQAACPDQICSSPDEWPDRLGLV